MNIVRFFVSAGADGGSGVKEWSGSGVRSGVRKGKGGEARWGRVIAGRSEGGGFGLRKAVRRDDYGAVRTFLNMVRREWIWPLVVAGVIFWASSRSRLTAPEFTDWMPNFDKLVHGAVYGLLATLTLRAARGGVAPWVVVIAVSVYGATDEWHQSFVPGRASSPADWVADTLGAAVAVGLYSRWGTYRRLLEMPLWRRLASIDGHGTAK